MHYTIPPAPDSAVATELELSDQLTTYLTVRDGHGGGWSRKINARYLHTLMVYL